MASIKIDSTAEPVYVKPTEIYTAQPNQNYSAQVLLRIATGGAGQSGLIRALAEAFISEKVIRHHHLPFAIAWLASDTSASFNYLATRSTDLSITYHPAAEEIAIKQGVAGRRVYAWRDHWLLVGPKSNPASLPINNHESIQSLFTHLFIAAIETTNSIHPVRFLSRYDKSANNIKESALWTSIGQTPWSHPYSTWYHKYVDFPFQALRAACQSEEYTLTDQGTWFAIESDVRERMAVFKAGGDEEDDVLLNPAHALVGTGVANQAMAEEFAEWLARRDGGQSVIERFEVGGTKLYSRAPSL